ncbi:MAG TPA: ligase-associated DNA damage response endonuclease PdeM [Burkholderiaceae bacterium]|nr:ligase-associated DNA damage response endonuclease PdeM [Burkholderiaceae bacterium]
MRTRLRVERGGESLMLLAGGAIHWESRRCLIVADAHFGKAATFRAHGVPVPQGTTRETLGRLDAWLDRTEATSVVFLGDLFHAAEAHASATLASLRAWREAHASLEVVLVEGNHDLRAGAPPADLGIEVRSEPWRVGGLSLCHHPQFVSGAHALAGHLHPAVRINGRADDSIRLPCFWLREGLTVLPAFGSFTGGARFDREPGDRVFAIAEDRLYEIPALRDAA